MAGKRDKRGTEAADRRSEELQQTLERLEEGVRDVFSSGRYAEYLAVMSRFHDYSVNNFLLIAMQKPEATLVAGYRAWQDKFGRHVRKGEHGIRILCPVVVRARPAGDAPREDAEQGKEKASEKRLVGFRMGTVFDVSQTEGRELPSLGVDELRGDVEGYEAVMGAIRKASRYPIVFEGIEGGAKGYFSRAEPKRIVIQEGMSQAQTLKTAVHELAHSVMHDAEPSKERSSLPRPRYAGGAGGERRLRRLQLAGARYERLQLRLHRVVERWEGRERAQGVARRDTQRLARDNRTCDREGGLEDTRAGRAKSEPKKLKGHRGEAPGAWPSAQGPPARCPTGAAPPNVPSRLAAKGTARDAQRDTASIRVAHAAKSSSPSSCNRHAFLRTGI